jgi:hypothetical protein
MTFIMSLFDIKYMYIPHLNYGRYVKDMGRPWPVNESNRNRKNNVNDIVSFIAHKLIVKVFWMYLIIFTHH